MNTPRIHPLPESVIKQIAAAEVVHRPATVVKELLENALDAHSRTIQLIIQEGGKQLIQVIDDGDGMAEEDAVRCFERYATSKISTVDDLFDIRTLGFRGEALASIAAVAHVELITKTSDQKLGTHVTFHGGRLKGQRPIPASQGTQITVKNLFFNIPARRNFLKSTATETKYILEAFQRAALSHPEVAFSYWQNGQQLYNLPPAKPVQRIVHLFGDTYHEHLIPCQEATDTIALTGHIAAPTHSKKTRGGQFLFVNGRYVKSTFIQHAIKKAFEGLILSDTFPFYILHLTVPPDTVDVHVHPMKTEVKFEDESLVYTLVSSAVKKALAVHHVIPSIDFDTDVNQDPLASAPPPVPTPVASQEERIYTQFKADFHHALPSDASSEPTPDPTLFKIESSANDDSAPPTHPHPLDPTQEKRFLSLQHTYVLTAMKSGLLVLDVKAAYERILYERYTQYLTHQGDAVQKLLFPISVHVAHADYVLLEACQPHVEKLGFRLEMTPPDTITFTAQPPEAQGQDLPTLVEELLEQYKASHTLDRNTEADTWAKSLAKRIASRRPRHKLTHAEMNALVDQLFACHNANYTPEGKRTWYRISVDAFARLLDQS